MPLGKKVSGGIDWACCENCPNWENGRLDHPVIISTTVRGRLDCKNLHGSFWQNGRGVLIKLQSISICIWAYLIIVGDAGDGVSVNFSARCKFSSVCTHCEVLHSVCSLTPSV